MERFLTSVRHHTWYEHWHRYHFVKEMVVGKKVCDIACGEGFGSHLLATVAKSVIGVDIDKQTIKKAQEKYKNTSNLNYCQTNALKTPFTDNEFDVLVSFETLEHLSEHGELLTEFKRILKPEGLLIISTPDKDVYSEINENHNHYHVKELNKQEFNQLTAEHFKYSQCFGQQFQLYSSIVNLVECGKKNEIVYSEYGNDDNVCENNYKSNYLINICCNNLEVLKNLVIPYSHNFAEAQNSLFEHYEKQIRNLIQVEQQFSQANKIISEQNNIINNLKARLGLS